VSTVFLAASHIRSFLHVQTQKLIHKEVKSEDGDVGKICTFTTLNIG